MRRAVERLQGLVAATHTPMDSQGAVNLEVVERQAEHLLADGVRTVFIGGTTGESHSLTVDERMALARRWSEVAAGGPMRVIVHVGANCLADARALAADAERLGASAIAALAPSYFKPASIEDLVVCCREITSAAPETPFYYYDIPSLTGVRFAMAEFLDRAAEELPTLVGIKFTNPDLVMYQQCLRAGQRRWDMAWGVDEQLLAALALGAPGAVGSTYNFAAPLYHRILEAFQRGDLEAAREDQYRAVEMVQWIARFGYMGAAKAVMGILGVDVGPPRLPHRELTSGEVDRLREGLEAMGFFEWAR